MSEAEKFYNKHLENPDVWPENRKQTEGWVDVIFGNYMDEWEKENPEQEMPEKMREELYEMVYAGVF